MGYVQRRGIDYDDVFAPVARLDSVRLLIALVRHEGWEVHHMDVKSAFLNGNLQEEVFVQQPVGFVKAREEHKVLRLCKALYGLHQAGLGTPSWMIDSYPLGSADALQSRSSTPGEVKEIC
jgi:hypothetical protein